MSPTPTKTNRDLNLCEFENLREALDYAAEGDTGYNFYDRRGRLTSKLPYRQLRAEALAVSARLSALGLKPGSRVALIAETQPEFLHAFFACQYAGLVPVTLPVSIHAGSHNAYVAQLHGMLAGCGASVALASPGYLPYLQESCVGLSLRFVGTIEELPPLPVGASGLIAKPAELAYLQYTSGSTRFPRGVMITHDALAANLRCMLHSCEVTDSDRCTSWLPFYHDMGLVGLVLAPMSAQRSVDFLPTQDFVMAPLKWLSLISENRSTISFSPPFGYELCSLRIRKGGAAQYDLSSWRVAGVGAEMIRPATLFGFADAFQSSGFRETSFQPSYGMAECSLALTFPKLGSGVVVDHVDAELLEKGDAVRVETSDSEDSASVRSFVECGRPMPGHEIEIRGADGKPLPDREIGMIFTRGPSNMSGYFNDEKATREVLSPDGWLNTGDLGYWTGHSLAITGRQKDMIIINGRNVWPQDLELLAEEELELRMGRALAFATDGPDGGDQAVIVVQSRSTDEEANAALAARLKGAVRTAFGFDCVIEFVGAGVLPRTSSGKLSRSAARKEFEERRDHSSDLVPFVNSAGGNAAGSHAKSAAGSHTKNRHAKSGRVSDSHAPRQPGPAAAKTR